MYLTSLYGYIHKVHGVVNVQELLISIDNGAFAARDIVIGDYEVARSEEEDIEIEVTG